MKTLRTEITEEEKQIKKISRDIQVKLSDINTCENQLIVKALPILEMVVRSSQTSADVGSVQLNRKHSVPLVQDM